jgi:hypothetical protein
MEGVTVSFMVGAALVVVLFLAAWLFPPPPPSPPKPPVPGDYGTEEWLDAQRNPLY